MTLKWKFIKLSASIAPEILKWQSVFLYNFGRLNDFIGQKCLKLKLRSAFVPTWSWIFIKMEDVNDINGANLFKGKKIIWAQILCYKKSGIHWYHWYPAFLWKFNFTLVRRLNSALNWDISGLWNRSDGRDYREKRIVISRFLPLYILLPK